MKISDKVYTPEKESLDFRLKSWSMIPFHAYDPDGVRIRHKVFNTYFDFMLYYDKWVSKFIARGFYKTRKGKYISPEDLEYHMVLKPVIERQDKSYKNLIK